MKTLLSSNQQKGLLVTFLHATVAAGVFFHAQNASAGPRWPLPPIPEKPPIDHLTFDQGYFGGETATFLTFPGIGIFDQSWSGYALERSGQVIPCVVPALGETGHTNITCDAGGSLRLWIDPYWSSQSQAGGIGPGAPSTILEFDAVSGVGSATVWSLEVSADGNTLALLANSDSGLQQVFRAPISWQAGQAHLLTLDYSPAGTLLYVDSSPVVWGSGLISIPLAAGQLVLGSTLSGTNAANADLDEFYSFDFLLSTNDVRLYYQMTGYTASLGPISAEEEAAWSQPRSGGIQMDSIRTPGNVYDPNSAAPCSPGGPVYITNITAALQTNGLSSVQFDIYGGVNGILYDIISTTNLAYSPPNYTWTWAGQGLTCSSVLLTNQPPDQAFYILEEPSQTITVAFGEDYDGQCNVPTNLTNAVAVAAGGYFSVAMHLDGTIVAWGDNLYGETNVPSGLSNVVGVAAGLYHGLALLTNGAVTNWGSYYDGTNFYSATNYSVAQRPPLSNVVAIAAGQEHDLALLSNGTVVAWGLPWADANWVPANLTNIQAVACGWYFNSALSSNGVVTNWGDATYGETTVPHDLTNAVAISANGYVSMGLRTNGTVEAWGFPYYGATNVPAGLSNVVAISAGAEFNSMALQADGNVLIWGYTYSPFTLPPGISGGKAISAGFEHDLLIESGWSPVITSEPNTEYAIAGGTATFSAQAQALAGLQYQWQFNGMDLSGQTNATLTLSSVSSANNGTYQVVVFNGSGSVTSQPAIFTLVLPAQIDYALTTPGVSSVYWSQPLNQNFNDYLSVDVVNYYPPPYSFAYQWQLNGTNIPSATSYEYFPTTDGIYNVVITNAAGSTNVTWNVRIATPGMVEAWGDDTYGECDRPATLTNALAVAAGDYHSVTVTANGTVSQWGKYWDGTNFYSLGATPTNSNLVAVAASRGHDIAVTTSGGVTTWGLNSDIANFVPTNLPPVKAVAAGWSHNVALLTNGTVVAWGNDTYGQTNVPTDLTNAVAIAAGDYHCLALRPNGTVEAWGDNANGQTNVPVGLTNVAAIACGGQHSLALQSNGIVIAWGLNTSGQTNVPLSLSNVIAIAAGRAHSVALQNTGTVVVWGDNTSGQTNIPAANSTYPVVMKSVAAGGDHTVAAIFSSWVQYPIEVSKDLLLIYNTNSPGNGSSNVFAYYLAHRPMVSNANSIAIGCTTNEIISPSDYATYIVAPIQNWLSLNPTKRPAYVILFQDIPSRVNSASPTPSVQVELSTACSPGWFPFVTSINMNGTGGTNDCIGYINKLAAFGSNYSPGKLVISVPSTSYGNTNYYLDDTRYGYPAPPPPPGADAETGILAANPAASITYSNYANGGDNSLSEHITNGLHLAGYLCWGDHSSLSNGYATNGYVQWTTNSGWYLIRTVESFNGQRSTGQGNFLEWYAANAFGGANYSNSPVGAVSYTDEPGEYGTIDGIYFGLWESGNNLAICAWNSRDTYFNQSLQVVGDPFVAK